MPSPIKFIDNPTSKTVTAVYDDGSTVIINAMSNNNYTNPPGYMQQGADIELVRQGLRDRVIDYRVYLNAQLNG